MRTIASVAILCLYSLSLAHGQAQAQAQGQAQAVFPTAISPKYASEKPNIARTRTCLDQYMENKATNSNGGLVWQHKGSGYHSECRKRLK